MTAKNDTRPEAPEDKTIGGVTWHSSEPEGGPDVGLSIYLGNECRLWFGEISNSLFAEMDGPEHFDNDSGRFIVWYKPEPQIVAKCGPRHEAQEICEEIAGYIRRADALRPTASEGEGWEPSDADIIAVAKKYYRETWGHDWHTQHCTHTQSDIARARQAFEFVLPQLSAAPKPPQSPPLALAERKLDPESEADVGAAIDCLMKAPDVPQKFLHELFGEEYAEHEAADLALAEENRVLREALKPFRPAYDAYVSTCQNFTIRGETLADQKASNREMIVTAEENAFQALAKITFEHLRAVEAALSTAHPSAQAYREAFDDLLSAGKRVLAHLNQRIDKSPSTAKPVFDGIVELHDAVAKAESCK